MTKALLNALLLSLTLGSLSSARLSSSSSKEEVVGRLLEGDSFTDNIKDFFTDERCLRSEKNLENLLDLSDWMSKLPNADSLKLMDLTLPGTHNSGSYDLTTDINLNDPEYEVVKEGTASLPADLVAQWSCQYALTQSLSLSEQLQAGVRYLDLRLDYDAATQKFRGNHMLFGLDAADLLSQVATFANDHPKEIIFLEIGPVYAQLTTEISEELQRLLTNTFAGKLVPTSTDVGTVTLGQLQNDGANLFVIVNNKEIVGDSNLLWQEGSIVNRTYIETGDVDTMSAYNTDRLNDFHARNSTEADELYKLQWILTPDARYIQQNPLEGSLYLLAQEANSKLGDFYRSAAQKQLGNVFSVDYVETSPLMKMLGLEQYSGGAFVAEPVEPQSKWTGAAKAGLGVGIIIFLCGLFCLCKYCKGRKKENA